jgi:hypothetical protein
VGDGARENEDVGVPVVRCRAARRRKGRLAAAAEVSAAASLAEAPTGGEEGKGVGREGSEEGGGWQGEWEKRRQSEDKRDEVADGGERRLETHVWHAKRMEMVSMWGHR